MDKEIEKEEKVVVSGDFTGSEAAVVPSFSPLESLRILEKTDETTGVSSFYYLTDVYLLLNSERIENVLGSDTFRNIMASMSSISKSDTSSVNISDSLLLENIKSRYLQTPSEMRSYVNDISSRFSTLKEKAERELLESKEKELKEDLEVKTEQQN